MLQAMKEDPPLDIKCRDKFLVQTVAITADKESQSATEIVQPITLGWDHILILTLSSGHMSTKMTSHPSKKKRFE